MRRLFWSELNYDRESAPLSRRGWPETVSGGADDDFEVIHCRLDSERLSLQAERRVMEKLYSEGHDRALFLFSDRARERWHFVNVRFGGEDGRRRLYRRIAVGPEEEHRTASERIAMLDLDAAAGGARTPKTSPPWRYRTATTRPSTSRGSRTNSSGSTPRSSPASRT